jgi:hypothetical protein
MEACFRLATLTAYFQLVNARYEKGAMILTSNRGFAEWGEVFGDPVVATALLDRLLHHAIEVEHAVRAEYHLASMAEIVGKNRGAKAGRQRDPAVIAGAGAFVRTGLPTLRR